MSMKIENEFEVPLSIDQAWEMLLDIEGIAPCFPGARLTKVIEPRIYLGEVEVRLGPVSLTFKGRAEFEDIDPVKHIARVKAQGTDIKGRGGANALVEFALTPIDKGTRVAIFTELNLSGSVAQYGRGVGMIKALADQIIAEFTKRLTARLREDGVQSDQPPEVDSAPLDIGGIGLRLIWGALLRWVRRLVGRPA